MIKSIITSIILLTTASAFSATYSGPGGKKSSAQNQSIYSNYCKGTAASASTPRVNYENEKVKNVARILGYVADLSFYYYSGPLYAYGLKKGEGAAPAGVGAPAGTTNSAHNFLAILCGEFRDRATMIEAKLNWVENLYKLPVAANNQILINGAAELDMSKSVWSQITANAYSPYLTFSRTLWTARKSKNSLEGLYNVAGTSFDRPVEGQLICETKYIFDQYIVKNKQFDSINNFESGYKSFAAGGANCSQDDKSYYYDFRGDSNFKPNSPESNGMIWYSSSITNQCKTTSQAKPPKDGATGISNTDCQAYFKAPFTARWNAARAGLATWLFRDKSYDDIFSSEGQSVYILPHKYASSKPFSFKIDGNVVDEKAPKFMLPNWSLTTSWNKSDIGFNTAIGVSSQNQKVLAYERLRDAVDRHTDWYSSGFDDGMGMVRDQAYSPFVASSYDMSASDGFTAPGVTVNSPSDGRKHWMFVFRVKKENWYNTESLMAGQAVDFDRQWFDETSLGTNHLAKSERAWDRMGTPLEDELDSIIYLHNIPTHGGVASDDGLGNPNE